MSHVLAQDLRNAVLQAAVQGKLTEHLVGDEPVSILKEKLFIDDKLVFPKSLPCDIPDYWEWIQIGNLGESIGTDSFSDGPFGSNLKKEHQIQRPEVRIIQLSNIGENGWKDENVKYTSFDHLDNVIPRCEVHPGDFVIAKMMPAGRTIEVPELNTRITLGSDAMKFVPNENLNKTYLLYVMHSNVFLDQVYSEVHGITRVRTTLNGVKSYILPIPPIQEQARIVARVDELMAKIDEYEKIEKELAELQKAFPGNMKDAILQAAMQGKLIEQLESDTKAKLTKITKPLDEDIPFDLPETWDWCTLQDIAKVYGGYAFKSTEYINTGVRVVRISDFNENGFVNNSIVRYKYDEKLDSYLLKDNDILMCMTGGTVGKTYCTKKLNEKMYLNQRVAAIRNNGININYLRYYIHSPFVKDIIDRKKNSTNDNISMVTINTFPFPLPPIEEQQRIVDKLDQLLPLCESLEAMI